MPTARTIDGRQYHGPEKHTLTLSAANPAVASANTVTFDVAYQAPPKVLVIQPSGTAGAWSAASITTTGFTISVVGETDADYTIGRNVDVYWFAMEET
jgi:hypothetical protein